MCRCRLSGTATRGDLEPGKFPPLREPIDGLLVHIEVVGYRPDRHCPRLGGLPHPAPPKIQSKWVQATTNEALNVTLTAGTYYVRIEAREAGESSYVFRLLCGMVVPSLPKGCAFLGLGPICTGCRGPWRPGSKRGKTRRPRGAQEGNEAACRARAAARAAPPFR